MECKSTEGSIATEALTTPSKSQNTLAIKDELDDTVVKYELSQKAYSTSQKTSYYSQSTTSSQVIQDVLANENEFQEFANFINKHNEYYGYILLQSKHPHNWIHQVNFVAYKPYIDSKSYLNDHDPIPEFRKVIEEFMTYDCT